MAVFNLCFVGKCFSLQLWEDVTKCMLKRPKLRGDAVCVELHLPRTKTLWDTAKTSGKLNVLA